MGRIAILLTALAAGLSSTPTFADGDAAAGKKVFNKCIACHDGKAEKNKVGPHLVGVVGRKIASVEGYAYSTALKDAGAAGGVWDEATLTNYLKSPKTAFPGNKMTFAGLKKDSDIADLIAWLKADPKP